MKYSIGLNVFLKHLAIQSLLDCAKRHESLENVEKIFPLRKFALGCQEEYPKYSYNECENIYRKFSGVLSYREKNRRNVFYLFHKIASEALQLESNGVCCKHSKLVSWRDTVHSAGQSVFICAFMAHEDVQLGNTRVDFAFSPYAPSDNTRLRNMLSLGMAENHFHLKGSAPAFMMSWICLMNHIAGRNTKNGFAHKFMKDRFFRSPIEDDNLTLCASTQIAALIRLKLNRWLDCAASDDDKGWSQTLYKLCKTSHIWVTDIQREINAERMFGGLNKLDYASNVEEKTKPYAPISGEHRFLYRMFHAIYSGSRDDAKEMQLPFLVYLMAYMRLRAELVQSNKIMGFQNFNEYQNRKDIFLDEFPKYKKSCVKVALDSALRHKSIRSLEARFYPNTKFAIFTRNIREYWKLSSGKEKALYRAVKYMGKSLPQKRLEDVLREISPERNLDDNNEPQLSFVTFLVKRQDESLQKDSRKQLKGHSPIKSRHHMLQRGEYARQIENIIRLRRSREIFAQRLLGIDACDHEFHARPEVFAFLFRKARYASSHMPYSAVFDNPSTKLRITYHVGEDFFDIVSGLRAIDEAINFLELSHGDRLGHALALGIEPAEFYALKDHRLFLSQQELLDNLAWLSYALKKHGLFDSALESWMLEKNQEYYKGLYRKAIPFSGKYHSVSAHVYINAWRLRGDNPKYYHKIEDEEIFLRKLKLAEPWELLRGDQYERIREEDIQARQLMHHYHYNAEIRIKGEEIVELEIPKRYAEIIQALQETMLKDVCRKGIGIETNPSSNYLIGTFRQYDKHPIVRFYNRWLNPSSNSPQAFVSINTDDQGVFDTDLENEYALMASALENAKDGNGYPIYNAADIISWLDDIRKMGLEQSFMLTHKYLTEGR